MSTSRKTLTLFLLVLTLFAGCSPKPDTATATPVPPTETAFPPTPTSLPMVLRVNGEGVLLSDYEEEIKRIEAAAGILGKKFTAEENKSRAIEDLSGNLLLSMEAHKNGFQISETDLDARLSQIAQELGGTEALNAWLQANFYSSESFRRSITRSVAAAWQRDKIINGIPNMAEQIHARQIVFTLESSANGYRQRVDGGTNFADLAAEADPVTKGDLGWFPRGYLLQREVEEAAFSLQVGEVSQVIKSAIGYHLVQVIEKDPVKELSPDAKIKVQNKAVVDWLSIARSQASIEILVP